MSSIFFQTISQVLYHWLQCRRRRRWWRRLSGPAKAFLDFCRVEKGLAANSICFVSNLICKDLARRFRSAKPDATRGASGELCRVFVQCRDCRPGRSPATSRRCAILCFLIREGTSRTDPTEFLTPPRQWTTLPKYLNREEIERLIAAPPDGQNRPDCATGPCLSCCTPPGCVSPNCAGWSWPRSSGNWECCGSSARATSSEWCRSGKRRGGARPVSAGRRGRGC